MLAPGPYRGGTGPRMPRLGQGALPAKEKAQAREKVERDVLKLIQAVQELKQEGQEQSLRTIAEKCGLGKDEVNRYLNPMVRELYDYERLMHVRRRNRPLYNWLIVSGPPKVQEGKWAGILANTSKHALFQAVCLKYGWVAKHLGQRGAIVDLEYRGIENITQERLGKLFSSQEAVLAMDDFLPPPGAAGEGS